jgi:hypothetical protein
MTHSQNCGTCKLRGKNQCPYWERVSEGMFENKSETLWIEATTQTVGCASWSNGQPLSLEQRLEQKALIDGGTRGLGDYLILKEMNNADKRTERMMVLDKLHEWFNNYCEGNEEPELWVAFIKAERALRSSKVGEQ